MTNRVMGRGATWALVVLLTLVAAVPRMRGIVERPLSLDEAADWAAAKTTLFDKLIWRHHFEHPPLAYAVEGWTLAITGDHPEWKVRVASFAAGVLVVPAAFVLGNAIAGPAAGFAAALLAAFDPVLVEQAREARLYSLFELLLLLTLARVVVLMRRAESPRAAWNGLGALAAALYWTSNAGLTAAAGILLALAWLAARDRRPSWTNVGWTLATFLVLCLPGFYRLLQRIPARHLAADAVAGPSRLATEWLTTAREAFGGAWALLLLPLAVAGLVILHKRQPAAFRLMIALAITNVVGLLLLRGVHPMLAGRYLLPMLPAVWIGAAMGLTAGPRVARTAAALAFAALVIARAVPAFTAPDPPFFEASTQVKALAPRIAPSDAVVYFPWFLAPIGEYYGAPPRPVIAVHGEYPRPDSLDGRRVVLVYAYLTAERDIEKARAFLAALAQRRSHPDPALPEAVGRGFTGIVTVEPDGKATVSP